MANFKYIELPSEEEIGKGWSDLFQSEAQKDYFKELDSFLSSCKAEIMPKKENIFKAFKLCHLEDVKVVILGQDPYYQKGKADGLCFSYNNDWEKPDKRADSLSNILKQLKNETGIDANGNTSLASWAKQGVLLLNTVLTVSEGVADSHKGQGWETFTDAVVKAVSQKTERCVFILWGGKAKNKIKLLKEKDVHAFLEGDHPCPMSAKGFFKEEGYFNKSNELLGPNRQIDWSL